ncbi:MAG TPA: methyltransferase domain-containing protein [Bryobacteraceae bacterium]
MTKRRKRERVVSAPAAQAAAVVQVEEPPEPPRCAACGNAEIHPLFETTDRLCRRTSKPFRIVACGQCGIMRLDPWPSAEEARAFAKPPAWPTGRTLADRLERAYRRMLLSDEARFVERVFRRSGVDGPLLDLSQDAEPLRRVLAGRGIRVLAGTPDDAPAAPETCATVTMLDTLDRLADPGAALETARACLHREGRLIVALANASCWQFLMFGENWSGLDVPRRLVHLRARDIDLLLDCCGFEVLCHKHFTWGRNPADFASSLAPALHPAIRRARGTAVGGAGMLAGNLLYMLAVGIAVPFTLIESACRAGSTILVEARRKW